MCSVVMEGASQCKFDFADGNKMKLVVEDDECKKMRSMYKVADFLLRIFHLT